MAKWEEITPATIFQIAWEIRDGEADPDDARRLLEHFCECPQHLLPNSLHEHLRLAFGAYLRGEKTIDAALGLTKRKGRPRADQDMRTRMAVEVLRRRMDGVAHQECLELVSEEYGFGTTIVGESWRQFKQTALIVLDLECSRRESGNWSPSEKNRLIEIFGSEPWFRHNGKIQD